VYSFLGNFLAAASEAISTRAKSMLNAEELEPKNPIVNPNYSPFSGISTWEDERTGMVCRTAAMVSSLSATFSMLRKSSCSHSSWGTVSRQTIIAEKDESDTK
jgi:hypothetical protein